VLETVVLPLCCFRSHLSCGSIYALAYLIVMAVIPVRCVCNVMSYALVYPIVIDSYSCVVVYFLLHNKYKFSSYLEAWTERGLVYIVSAFLNCVKHR
jgi:hypothetical protein